MKARAVEGLEPGGPLRPAAARIVTVRLAELRGFADEALRPDASRAQHSMRIAAKRLRYLLEIFEPCLGEEARAARDAAKRLQGVLGDLHDCDLMLPRVAAIDSAEALLRARREGLFHQFIDLWRSETAKRTWSNLETALRS